MASLRARASMTTLRRMASGDLVDVRPWPHDPTIAHLVLLDVSRTPARLQIEDVTASTFADDPALRSIRTSALFPGPRERFAAAGYRVCDRLALLERPIDRIVAIAPPDRAGRADSARLRRLHQRRLAAAEEIDRAAFASGWANSASTLADILLATPRHRARLATIDRVDAGFAITGLAGQTGYLQRLAVLPSHQRRGVARRLVGDALRWLQHRGASTVLVNTGVDNEPALELYRSMGFRHRRDELVVMECTRGDARGDR